MAGLELMKYDVENAKKLTKDLRRRDDPGVLLLTSDDSESLTRVRSVAFQALRMCALKSQPSLIILLKNIGKILKK